MALIIKDTMISSFLKDDIVLKNGAMSNVIVEEVVHLDVVTYPSQENYENGAIVGFVKRPFIEFIDSCGGAASVTPEMISEKYGNQIPTALSNAILYEIINGYDNYLIIPDGMSLAVAGDPYTSIYDLTSSPQSATIEEMIEAHNTDDSAHADMRSNISDLMAAVQTPVLQFVIWEVGD